MSNVSRRKIVHKKVLAVLKLMSNSPPFSIGGNNRVRRRRLILSQNITLTVVGGTLFIQGTASVLVYRLKEPFGESLQLLTGRGALFLEAQVFLPQRGHLLGQMSLLHGLGVQSGLEGVEFLQELGEPVLVLR